MIMLVECLVVVYTDLPVKEPHNQLIINRVIISLSPGSEMVGTVTPD